MDDDDVEFDSDFLFRQTADENATEEEQDDEIVDDEPPLASTSAFPLIQPPSLPIESLFASAPRATSRESRSSRQRSSLQLHSRDRDPLQVILEERLFVVEGQNQYPGLQGSEYGSKRLSQETPMSILPCQQSR